MFLEFWTYIWSWIDNCWSKHTKMDLNHDITMTHCKKKRSIDELESFYFEFLSIHVTHMRQRKKSRHLKRHWRRQIMDKFKFFLCFFFLSHPKTNDAFLFAVSSEKLEIEKNKKFFLVFCVCAFQTQLTYFPFLKTIYGMIWWYFLFIILKILRSSPTLLSKNFESLFATHNIGVNKWNSFEVIIFQYKLTMLIWFDLLI